MTRDRFRQTIVVVAVLVLAVATVAPAASAQTDDESFFDGLIDAEGGTDWSTQVRMAVLKALNFDRVVTKFTTAPGNATQYAEAFQATFNEHNESIETYVNKRLDASTNYDVIAIYFHDRSGGNVTRYLVANVSDGNFTNARIVDPARFDDLNRTVDHYVWADWYVSARADREVSQFVERYVETGDMPTWTYRTTMLAKYGSGIRGSLWESLDNESDDGGG